MTTKPPFPIGLTLDEALKRGWRPGEGRALIVTDDGPIREPGPFDDVIDLLHQQPAKRRRSGDSSRDRIRAAMRRGKAIGQGVARADPSGVAKPKKTADEDQLVADVIRLVANALRRG